jgi:hypothetical protein
MLQQHTLDVNVIHYDCPLTHWAAFNQYAKVLDLLLNAGADVIFV